jgi:hypothetical protein
MPCLYTLPTPAAIRNFRRRTESLLNRLHLHSTFKIIVLEKTVGIFYLYIPNLLEKFGSLL